jgi:hypothetical protein
MASPKLVALRSWLPLHHFSFHHWNSHQESLFFSSRLFEGCVEQLDTSGDLCSELYLTSFDPLMQLFGVFGIRTIWSQSLLQLNSFSILRTKYSVRVGMSEVDSCWRILLDRKR